MTNPIGASLPRPDALGKITGAARYPGDLMQLDMLHLSVVFARQPHARITDGLAYSGGRGRRRNAPKQRFRSSAAQRC